MTTRRRHTASETGYEEPLLNSATILPATSEFNTPLILNPELQLSFPWNSNPHSNALYKKTDVPSIGIQVKNGSFQTQTINNFNNIGNSASSSLKSQPLIRNSSSVISNDSNFINLSWQSNANDLEIMASRDRTHEFIRIIRSQQGSLANGALTHKTGKRPKDFQQYADFMQRAKLIGRNISSTYAKLEKLTHLAKKRSLFDDSQDQEIQELTGIIRHDISSLTKHLEDLQNRSRLDNSHKDGSGHLQKHSANLVGSLQTKVAVITQQFKDVLEVRTENLKKQAERREQYAGGMISGELPMQAVVGHRQGSVLLADEAAAVTRSRSQGIANTGDVAIDFGNDSGSSSFQGAVGTQCTAYQQQLQLMEEQDAYLQSRADTMKTIETTIVELGQMFTQLATMVKEQEEIVHRIDSNVDNTEMNIEGAHTELLKYFKSVSSNRWLMLKVFGVLIFFFIVFVVFMA